MAFRDNKLTDQEDKAIENMLDKLKSENKEIYQYFLRGVIKE
jgi:hypothetical protein